MTLLASLAELVAMQGRFDEALALVDRAVAIGEEFGLTFQLARIRDHTMSVHLLRGALEAAEHELRWSTDAYQTMGEAARRSSDAELLALVLYDQGRYDEAGKYAELGKRLSAPDDVVTLAYLAAGVGETPRPARRARCRAPVGVRGSGDDARGVVGQPDRGARRRSRTSSN